jgi:hypothetical protein
LKRYIVVSKTYFYLLALLVIQLFSFREHKKLIVYSVLILNKLILLEASIDKSISSRSLRVYWSFETNG